MLQNQFEIYLSNLKISSKSLKNYKSDIAHFLAWLILRLRTYGSYVEDISEAVPFLGKDTVIEYVSFLKENRAPNKTINRRLSTLRHLAKFLVAQEIMDSSFMEGFSNISEVKRVNLSAHPLVNDFKSYLEAEKISKNTIKNYLSDIKQFLTWLEINNHAQLT